MDNSIENRFMQFCDWLRETRRLRTDKELGNTLGIPTSLISMIRTGKRGFSVSTLATIASNHPQLNTYWLLTGVGSMLDGKKVLYQSSLGIQEYVPEPYDPHTDLDKETDVYDPLRGAQHATHLTKTGQENLLLKREVEKWKNKYIECLENKITTS